MIPSIPGRNSLTFDSSGKDGDDIPYLLDKFPMTDGGWAASCLLLRKAFSNKPIIKARREADNVECDVFPYKIKPGLAGIHPNSTTSLGITLEEFANGGAVRCVRLFNQLDGEYGGSGSGEGGDVAALFSSAQPRIVSSSGAFKQLGVAYGIDFFDPSTASFNILSYGARITQQKSFALFPAKRGSSGSGSYYMGLFGGATSFNFGEVGNFGAQATTAFFGSFMTSSDDLNNDESAVTGFKVDGANSSIHRNGVTIRESDVGSRVPTSSNSPQYGDYYISSGFGIMTGPIIWNLSDSDINLGKGDEITQYVKDLLEI